MLVGYMRVSKSDGTQVSDLQLDALRAAGVGEGAIYEDRCSGSKDDRPQLAACLKALRKGDVLVIWRLDRLGRNLKHLIETIDDLSRRGVGFQCLTGLQVDTTTPAGRFMLQVFGGLAEFERHTIRERTMAGLAAARARGRKGGRKSVFTAAKLRRAQAAMANRDTAVSALCKELGVSTASLYRFVKPDGQLTERGAEFLKK